MNWRNRPRVRISNDPLTKEDALRLMSGITDDRDRMLIELGINTGTRVNEMASLRVDKVDFVNNAITVWDDKHNKHKGNKKAGTYVKLSEGTWRKIEVDPRVMIRLHKWYIHNVKVDQEMFWDVSWITLERAVAQWTKSVLHNEKRWHCLRDTFVTLSREQGKSLEYVMKQTGDTGAMILNRYSKITPDRMKREAAMPIM